MSCGSARRLTPFARVHFQIKSSELLARRARNLLTSGDGLSAGRRRPFIRILFCAIRRWVSHLLNVTMRALYVGAPTLNLRGVSSAESSCAFTKAHRARMHAKHSRIGGVHHDAAQELPGDIDRSCDPFIAALDEIVGTRRICEPWRPKFKTPRRYIHGRGVSLRA
jgi:hypothetical protein